MASPHRSLFAELAAMTPPGISNTPSLKRQRPGDATPASFSNPWRAEEDEALVASIQKHGKMWTAVSRDLHMYRRSVAMCRNRYARMMAPLKDGDQAKSRNICKICKQIKRGHTCTGEPGGDSAAKLPAVTLMMKGIPVDTLALKQPIELPAIDPTPSCNDGHPILPMASAEGYTPPPMTRPLAELDVDMDELEGYLGNKAREREWDDVVAAEVKPDTPTGFLPTPVKEADKGVPVNAAASEADDDEELLSLLAPPPLGHGRSFFKSSFDVHARFAFAPTATKQASTCLLVGDVLDSRPSSPPPAIPSLDECLSPPSFSQDF